MSSDDSQMMPRTPLFFFYLDKAFSSKLSIGRKDTGPFSVNVGPDTFY